ncbi:MAG: B12-binding domain-containing radical SAM protein [Thermodesulfobacteriota bacterium]
MKILFLQLPCLDNDTSGVRENPPMAGFCLLHSLGRAGKARVRDVRFLSAEEEALDDRGLTALIGGWRPDLVCATLYLWNVERTLHLLRRVRKALPFVRFMVGGPEVAPDHPFLFRSLVPDVAVAGEGEWVFPRIVRALRSGTTTDLHPVAWKAGRRYCWGRTPAPLPGPESWLPDRKDPRWRPDGHGMAYLESTRGCPMRCSYCRYSHLGRGIVFLDPSEVLSRARALAARGAREIRFVDPTFNAHPAFEKILESLGRLHRETGVRFFAEVQAESLHPAEIHLMARAGFSEIEVGVQSRDRRVLGLVRRPSSPNRLEENLTRMIGSGIPVTVDLMYGLPGQDKQEVMESIQWARALGPLRVQCLQTLVLPGTTLREDRRKWGIQADSRPPYGIRSTHSMSWDDIREIEAYIRAISPEDCMTRRFVGHRLPDLFPERIRIDLERRAPYESIPGRSSRKALIFSGHDLFGSRAQILTAMTRALRAEPHILWQFVLHPREETPLDLMEEMISRVRDFPPLWLDRFASVSGWSRIASRRVFVLLQRGARCSRSWVEAVEALLGDHFF